MSQVGCVFAHPVADVPPYVISPLPPEISIASYYSRVVVYDCRGGRIGQATLGIEKFRGLTFVVQNAYDGAIAGIKEVIPSFETFIDVRTLEHMKAGCCPHQLLLGDEE